MSLENLEDKRNISLSNDLNEWIVVSLKCHYQVEVMNTMFAFFEFCLIFSRLSFQLFTVTIEDRKHGNTQRGMVFFLSLEHTLNRTTSFLPTYTSLKTLAVQAEHTTYKGKSDNLSSIVENMHKHILQTHNMIHTKMSF